MAAPAELVRPQFTSIERVGVELHFWPNVIDIMQMHDTQVLRARSLQIAKAATNIDVAKFEKTMKVVKKAYNNKKPRKFTGQQEENHSHQVFLIAAEIIGLENLTTEKAQIALGHNLIEDTAMPLEYMEGISTETVYSGIYALSHKKNGEDRYPDSEDKTEHFLDMIDAHGQERHIPLEILAIKLADFIAVGNDPLTKHTLVSPDRAANWNALTEDKIEEMELFQRLLSSDEIGLHRRLREAIAFTKLRQDPEAVAKLKAMFQARQSMNGI